MIKGLIIRLGIQEVAWGAEVRGHILSVDGVCVGWLRSLSARGSARRCVPLARLIRMPSSWSKVTLFCRCCWLDKNVRLRFSGCLMQWLFTHMGHGWQVCKHSVWAKINKFFFFFFYVCPLSWRTKVWSWTKREEKSKERMIKARKTLLKCYGRGKYACMPYVGGHCRKPSQHAVRYPPNTFTSSSVLCTIGLHSYLNRNLHFGVMRCQNDSYCTW